MAWDKVLEDFRTYQEAAGLRERTIQGREETLRALARHSGCDPNQLEFNHLTRFLARRHAYTGNHLSPGTKQVERSYLQLWSKWAQAEEIIKVDHAKRLPRVNVVPRRVV